MKKRFLSLAVVLPVLFSVFAFAKVLKPYGCTDCFNFVAPNVNGAENVEPAEIGLIVYDTIARAFRGFSQDGKWLKLSNESSIRTMNAAASLSPTVDIVFADSSSSAFAISLPSASESSGHIYTVKKISADSNAVSILPTSSQTIDGASAIAIAAKNEVTRLVSDGSNWLSLNQVGVLNPPGTLIAFTGGVVPVGYLAADGSTVSRATYASLFASIGTTYGAGDGSTTFNLPNASGVFLRGAGSQVVSGITYSATFGTVQSDQLQGHQHNLRDGHQDAAGTGTGFQTNGQYYSYSPTSQVISDGTNGSPRIGLETRPVNLSVKYLVKF